MVKHYFYYTYNTGKIFGFGVVADNDINFPVAYVMERLLKDYGCLCIVTFWQEIDRSQWERVNELINKDRNDDKRCIGCFGT